MGDGDVWLCRGKGQPAVRLAQLGRTNGIEVSADGAWLFVSESFNKGGNPVSNVIWRFPIAADGAIDPAKKELVIDFGAADGSGTTDVDGMRLDTAGRLYVTRHNGASVVVVDPLGTNKVLERIPLPFSAPTNLEFGGPDGKTLFVVGRCGIKCAATARDCRWPGAAARRAGRCTGLLAAALQLRTREGTRLPRSRCCEALPLISPQTLPRPLLRTPYGTGDGCIEAIDRPVAGLYWTNLQKGFPKVAV